MATTEEDVDALYQELIGETFVGTYTNDWKSNYSLKPQSRQIIESSQLGQHLHQKLKDIEGRLEGQVWKGFVSSWGNWKFYVTLKGEHEIGESALIVIRDFEVFQLSERRNQYESGLGVSITVTMVRCVRGQQLRTHYVFNIFHIEDHNNNGKLCI